MLVFEKTKHGDLACFMNSEHGKNLDTKGRLNLCAEYVVILTI